MSPQEYAHLLPAERILWARWLLDHRQDYDVYDYDVRVGRGRPADPRLTPENQDMWKQLTQHRIDVVGYKGRFPTIFQVAIESRPKDLGHLEMYKQMFVEDFPNSPPPAQAIVCERIHPEQERIMKLRGVIVYLVTRPPGTA